MSEPIATAGGSKARLLDCRHQAEMLKDNLRVLEGYSDLWQMADAIYRDLDARVRQEGKQ